MEKKFYTFEEILLALRDEYIKNQLLLKKLNKFYEVYGKSLDEYYIGPKFKEVRSDGSLICDKHLYLHVHEKVNKLRGAIVKLLNRHADMIGHIVYDINSSNGQNYSFKKESANSPSKEVTINVTNPLEFDKLVEEILNSEFMSLNKVYKSPMFGGYSLDIDGSSIFCGKFGENILYDAYEDVVQFRGIDCQCEAQSFIRQPIPESYLYDDIKKLIDKNIKPNREIKIDEYNFSKVTRFDVKEQYHNLRLVKRK